MMTKNAEKLPPAPAADLRSAIVRRQITDGDLAAAAAILHRGFGERTLDYWRRALQVLRDRPVPDGYPRYGYVLADRGRLVGIVLLIFSRADDSRIRANVASWYVDPAYRAYSTMLLPNSWFKDITLFNISPAPGTFQTIAAQGFSRYVEGAFHAVAAAGPPVFRAKIRAVLPGAEGESPLLADHAARGCLSFEVIEAGEVHPFVFFPTRIFKYAPRCAQLVYCRNIVDFVRFAGPLGRRLLLQGCPWVMLDANGPVDGLWGRYSSGWCPKYCRNGTPRLGDLSYTELVLFRL